MKNAIVIFAGLVLSIGSTSAQQAPAGDIERGKSLYEETGCYACHGLAAQGAQATGPRLSRTALPFEAFLVFLRTPVNKMPPYEATVLPDQEVADISAYLRQMPAPRDPESIPLLNTGR